MKLVGGDREFVLVITYRAYEDRDCLAIAGRALDPIGVSVYWRHKTTRPCSLTGRKSHASVIVICRTRAMRITASNMGSILPRYKRNVEKMGRAFHNVCLKPYELSRESKFDILVLL
jgi:hypothetical protein